jgi:hypothetical protein
MCVVTQEPAGSQGKGECSGRMAPTRPKPGLVATTTGGHVQALQPLLVLVLNLSSPLIGSTKFFFYIL